MLDREEAERLLREALRNVHRNANPEWTRAALTVLFNMALTNEEFDTDPIWETLDSMDVETHERRAIGAVITKAQRLGWIEETGRWRKSERSVNHRNDMRIWRSLIYVQTRKTKTFTRR